MFFRTVCRHCPLLRHVKVVTSSLAAEKGCGQFRVLVVRIESSLQHALFAAAAPGKTRAAHQTHPHAMTAPLHIALIKDGEPLPQTCRPFYLRTGNLARVLASRGHQVTWHSSNFLHYQKELYPETGLLHLEEGYDLHLHYCGTYPRNISPQRWVHHARLAREVYRELMQAQHLDVIVCCVPTLESAWACSLVAKKRGVPLIVDVRDPWPEVFVSAAPARLRPLARAVLAP